MRIIPKKHILHRLLIALLAIAYIACSGEDSGERSNGLPEIQPEAQSVAEAPDRVYRNAALGFTLEVPPAWTLEEQTVHQEDRRMVMLTLRRDDARVTVRATEQPWSGFLPLVRAGSRAGASGRTVTVSGVEGTRVHVPRTGEDYLRVERDGLILECLGPAQHLDSLLAGFEWIARAEPEHRPIPLMHTASDALPEQVQAWVAQCRKLDRAPTAVSAVFDDRRYLFVSRGRTERPVRVRIADAVQAEEEVVVRVHFSFADESAEGSNVAAMENVGLPIRFVAEGTAAPRQLHSVVGVERLAPIVAESDAIKVFRPAPNSSVDRRLEVAGVALVFEGTVQYRLQDAGGGVLDEGFTTAASGVDWGYYAAEVTVPESISHGSELQLELYTTSARDGREIDVVRIPLKLLSDP